MLGLAWLPGAAPAYAASFAGQPSLVRCTPVAMPARAHGSGHHLVRQAGDGRFFAPTRQAMFFSHKGDRCVWHGADIARG